MALVMTFDELVGGADAGEADGELVACTGCGRQTWTDTPDQEAFCTDCDLDDPVHADPDRWFR